MNIFSGLSQKEAKKLFRKKVMQCHPDKGGNAEEFIHIRNQYNEFLRSAHNISSDDADDLINATFKDDKEMIEVFSFIFEKLPSEWKNKNMQNIKTLLNYINENQKVKSVISGLYNIYNLLK